MLLLLTLIGVTASNVTGLEEKMAGNLRDRNLAFQAAETALRAGEEQTSSLLCPIFTRVGGFYPYTNAATATENIPQIANDSWWVTSGNTYNYTGGILEHVASTAQPRYIIQCVEENTSLYRITARGTGGTTDAVVILQSIYKR